MGEEFSNTSNEKEPTSACVAFVGGYGSALRILTDHAPEPGETILGLSAIASAGGKASNQAIGAKRLGFDACLLTAVGNDDNGEAAFDLWKREGVDAGGVRLASASTMFGVIIVDAAGENRIVVVPGALATLTAHDVEQFESKLRTAAVCVVSLEIALEAAVAALKLAHRLGVTTILAPAPYVALPADVWSQVDIVLPNRGEASLLLDLRTRIPDCELAHLLEHTFGVRAVVTLGSAGAVFADGDQTMRVFTPHQEIVVDTTGAGDSFTAAFACAIASGLALSTAVAWGVAAGSLTVQREEVVASLPYRNQVQEQLSQVITTSVVPL